VLDIYLDGDACPVKSEACRVALRHDLKVFVVSHGPLRVTERGRVEHVRVKRGFDAADDWIAERAGRDDVVVTADVPLADRCLKRGARVLTPTGRILTEDSIGDVLASRNLADYLRQIGERTSGPPPFAAADRSRFLSRLEETIRAVQRSLHRPPPADPAE
jgi:uncharacterized protein